MPADTDYRTAALDRRTWPAMDALLAANNGVYGGCWCLAFHTEGGDPDLSSAQRRVVKARLVAEGRTHAALVLDSTGCVGWCQYGQALELPRIRHRQAYAGQVARGEAALPDWRVTCFFVAPGHRRRGVARLGLAAALGLIAAAGGGLVEAYPERPDGRRLAAASVWAGTVPLFEAAGFAAGRRLGTYTQVMTRRVAGDTGGPAAGDAP